MLSGKESRLLAVLLALVLVTPLNAAPTVGRCDISPLGLAASSDSPIDSRHLWVTGKIVNLGSFDLSWDAAEVANPQMDWAHPIDSTAGHAKSLPGVPGAFFLVLPGFFCISLVKDRSAWLTAAIGLLCLAQAGLVALPHLAQHLRTAVSFLRTPMSFLRKQESRYLAPRFTGGHSILSAKIACPFGAGRGLALPQFAITDISRFLIYATKCPVSAAEQLGRFSPAFTFARLARGPPGLALKTFVRRG